MQFRPLAILSSIVPLAFPTLLLSQSGSGFQLFTAYDNSYPNGGLGTGGVGLTLGNSQVGIRASYGVSLATVSQLSATTNPAVNPNSGRWSGDADIIFADNLFGLGALLPGIHPYGLAGIGVHSVQGSPTFTDAVKTWSYGGGISLALAPTFSVDGEFRNRTPISNSYSTTDFTPGMEFRAGITLRLGAGGSRSRYSSGGGIFSGGTASGNVWPAGNTGSAGAATRVIPDGEKYLGVPYVWGGSTPQGFDCSGFVQYVYAHEGVRLPRTSRQMAASGYEVNRNSMAVGDLILFAETGEEISHVALYAGNGRILHATASGSSVRYDDLNSQRGQWFATHIVRIRRVVTPTGTPVNAFAQGTIPFDHFDPPDHAPAVVIKR